MIEYVVMIIGWVTIALIGIWFLKNYKPLLVGKIDTKDSKVYAEGDDDYESDNRNERWFKGNIP